MEDAVQTVISQCEMWTDFTPVVKYTEPTPYSNIRPINTYYNAAAHSPDFKYDASRSRTE